MQRVVASGRELPVYLQEILNARHLRGNDDAIMTEPHLFGGERRAQRTLDHRFDVDFLRGARLRTSRVVVHQRREKVLVERAPVHADPDWFAVIERYLDDRAKILVAPFSTHIARIDPVFVEGSCRGRVLREQQMTVVVEVSDQWYRDAHVSQVVA